MISEYKISECKLRIAQIPKKEKLKMVYMWTKSKHISLKEFLVLIEHIEEGA